MESIDWSLYNGVTDGRNARSSRKAYEELIKVLDSINGKLLSEYVDNRTNIRVMIDEVIIEKQPIELKTKTYKGIINFKNKLKLEGDEFVKFVRTTPFGKLQALVELKDINNTIVIDANAYTQFVKAKNKYMDLFEENGYEMVSPYNGAVEPITLMKDGIKLETTPSMFKSTILKSMNKFIDSLEVTDTFVRCVDYTSVGYLVELSVIDEFDNFGKIQIHIGQYTKFKKTRREVYEYIKSKGYIAKSIYKGAEEKILIDFNCEHEDNWVNANSFKRGCNCPVCVIENNTGENHCCWKGGITELNNYLRAKVHKWKVDSFNNVDRRCCITNLKLKDNVVHHVVGFNTIVDEVMDELNYQIHNKINLYTEYQLNLMSDMCLEKHYKYGLGVVLTEVLHTEFHSIYGKGNNTPEQFEEFKNNKLRELEEIA